MANSSYTNEFNSVYDYVTGTGYNGTANDFYNQLQNNQETLAKYEQIRKEAIIDILSEYGLVKKEQRIKALSEPELIEKGKEFPGDIQLRNQLKELNLDR